MTQDFEHSYLKITKFLDVLENDNIYQNNLQEFQKVMMINEEISLMIEVTIN